MAWNGNNDSLMPHVSKNYMYGDKVYILDEITADNCAYLIGDLSTFVLNEQNMGKKLMFFINSPGGCVYTMMTIIGLMNMARLNNIEVFTFVLGLAGSAASILAVQGDQRFMSDISRHFVHFGCIFDVTTKQTEIEKAYKQNKEYVEDMQNLYLNACNNKFTKEVLQKLQSDERGYLNAEQCLKYGLCDVIIEDDLRSKCALELKRMEFEKVFPTYLKEKEKVIKEKTKKKVKKSKKISKKQDKVNE